MGFIKLLALSSISILTLCGCSNSLTVKVTEDDIVKYNTVVDKTLESYSKGLAFSKEIKESLLNFILTDGVLSEGLLIHNRDNLSDDIKEEFKNNILVDDYYFTAFGASNLREVIIFNSPRSRLITTIIWNTDGSIESLERVVVKL